MSDFGIEKWVKKSRKLHQCVYCKRLIPIGKPYRRYVGVWQGDFQDWCACDFCAKIVEKTLDISEGIGDDDFYYWALDVHGKCLCGSHDVDYNWHESKTEIIFSCNKCDLIWSVEIPLEIKSEVTT